MGTKKDTDKKVDKKRRVTTTSKKDKAISALAELGISIRSTYKIENSLSVDNIKCFLDNKEIYTSIERVDGKYYGIQVISKNGLLIIHTGKDGLVKNGNIISGNLRIVAEK